MNDTALEAVEVLRFLNGQTPRLTTSDEAAGRATKLRDWAQLLLPQAQRALAEVAHEGGQREAIIRIIGGHVRWSGVLTATR
ncbi:hypothetical protein [Streptomyces sp. NBC_00134]|uniref:hypothetical protein n=1 Tax=Streptomyces sp. NBC_00134 TaxID=2975663 RepID=UPI00325301AF